MLLQVCRCSGYLELQLMRVENARGQLANGECCVASRGQSVDRCAECETYFRACLKEFQTEISATGPCSYGFAATEIISKNSFDFKRSRTAPNSDAGTIHIPFEFAWPVSVRVCESYLDQVKK